MAIYIKLFEVLFPVFFVVGIGYYLGKKNPKIDTTFITNFAANVGTPAMIIYALNPVNISFNIFLDYFWYYSLAICYREIGDIKMAEKTFLKAFKINPECPYLKGQLQFMKNHLCDWVNYNETKKILRKT